MAKEITFGQIFGPELERIELKYIEDLAQSTRLGTEPAKGWERRLERVGRQERIAAIKKRFESGLNFR